MLIVSPLCVYIYEKIININNLTCLDISNRTIYLFWFLFQGTNSNFM